MKLRNFLITLSGLIVVDFLPLYKDKSEAKSFANKDFKEIELIHSRSKLNNFEKYYKFSNKNLLNRVIKKDLKNFDNHMFNLLALENENVEEKFNLDIVSDIQYQKENKFYAEGNVILYFSNSTLTGDLIIYNKEKKIIIVEGNVTFTKGEQFMQASKIFFDAANDLGYIENVYGILDSKTLKKDLNIDLKSSDKDARSNEKINFDIEDLKYINTATFGLVNDFEEDKRFNITNINLKIPQVTRWRFKSKKINFNAKTLSSDKIFFTNDVYNEPQFIFQSKKFSGEILDNKLKLISRNSRLILDDKLSVPIGRRSVFEKDRLTRWGIGADFSEKDGYFIFRGTEPRNIFGGSSIKFQPYFLIQRALQGDTKSFTENNSSVFSSKVKNDSEFLDYFALDIDFNSKPYSWNLDSKIKFNSLNTDRLDESLRSKLTLQKRIDLNQGKGVNEKIRTDNDFYNLEILDADEKISSEFGLNSNNIYLKEKTTKNEQTNFLDFQFYNIFREKVIKDFATEEIYFASGMSIANKKSWKYKDNLSNFSLIYDLGTFKSKSRSEDEFKNLFRNVFFAKYDYKFPLWKNSSLDKKIDKNYKYSPRVINQSLNWESGIKQGLFLYGDGSSQTLTRFNTGPVFTIGSLKKNLLDYTYLKTNISYSLKSGKSPFSFDNVNEDPRISFNFEQQLYGPLIFSYSTILNLEDGKYTKPNYGLDFKRRAYEIGLFYNSADESLGLKFNIFNFDYKGLSPKF